MDYTNDNTDGCDDDNKELHLRLLAFYCRNYDAYVKFADFYTYCVSEYLAPNTGYCMIIYAILSIFDICLLETVHCMLIYDLYDTHSANYLMRYCPMVMF